VNVVDKGAGDSAVVTRAGAKKAKKAKKDKKKK